MKIDRLISIIMILLERGRVSIPELAEICEVSSRTVSRDLETINQAGVPIVSYPGLHGGVGIMENYKLEKRLFSTTDVTTLLIGLGCIRTTMSGQEVANALAKVKGFIPEEQRREIELKAGRLAIDMTPWVGKFDHAESIELIQQAMEQNRLLEFQYRDRHGKGSHRTLEPYRLLLKEMRWYLDGYCLEREDFRLFKLSRMEGLRSLETMFSPHNYRPTAMVQPNFQDQNLIEVTLLVRGSAAGRLEDVFGIHVFETADGEWQSARISISNDARGYCFLLSFGAECQVLEPVEVRARMRDYIESVAEFYTADS